MFILCIHVNSQTGCLFRAVEQKPQGRREGIERSGEIFRLILVRETFTVDLAALPFLVIEIETGSTREIVLSGLLLMRSRREEDPLP